MVNAENVYKVCDEPHPNTMREMFQHCLNCDLPEAFEIVDNLYRLGYSVDDIISTMFRIAKTVDIPEVLRLEYIKVSIRKWDVYLANATTAFSESASATC